jgi:hypothetical protein
VSGARVTLLAWCALALCGCDRTSMQLSLGLDYEDKAAQSWLGYYPSHFEPVGDCPGQSAFQAAPVMESQVKKAFERLEKTFAVEIQESDAHDFTGKWAPKLDAAQLKAMEAEANLNRAQQLVDLEADSTSDLFDPAQAKESIRVARQSMRTAREKVAPTMKSFLVRGVSYNPAEAPEVQVCYGDLQVFDKHTFVTVPKLYRAPMVVWASTPPRRARISVGSPPP